MSLFDFLSWFVDIFLELLVLFVMKVLPVLIAIALIFVVLFILIPFLIEKLLELILRIKAKRKYGIENYTRKIFKIPSSNRSFKHNFDYEYAFLYYSNRSVFRMDNLCSDDGECNSQDYIEFLLMEFPVKKSIILKNDSNEENFLVFDKNTLIEEIKKGENVRFIAPICNRGIVQSSSNNLTYVYIVHFEIIDDIVLYGDKEFPTMRDIEDFFKKNGISEKIISWQVLLKKKYVQEKRD